MVAEVLSEPDISPLLERLREALTHSEPACGQARRIFHGRGGGFPGLEWLTLDDFGEGLWLVLFREPPEASWQVLQTALREFEAVRAFCCVQYRYRRPVDSECLWGEVPEDVVAREGDWQFGLTLSGRQNTGYFMDAAPGRRWLLEHTRGRPVLNLFAYTCAFSVAAHSAGAQRVVNVDMSRAALKTGRDNHRRNGQSMTGVEFLAYDIFRSWKRIRQLGPYGVIIVDPPSFQRGSFDARKDYARVLRRIPELAEPGADILLCLNAPYLDKAFLSELLDSELSQAALVGYLAGREDFPELSPALKMLHCRWG